MVNSFSVAAIIFPKFIYALGLSIPYVLPITQSLLIRRILSNQLLPCELIPERNDLKLPIEANHHIANKQIIKFDLRVLYLLEEDLVILDIILNRSGVTISIWLPGTK